MIACCILALQLADPAPDIAPFPTALPAAVGIDPAALERLKIRAGRANSDAVLIVKDGKIIADWTFGKSAGPIEAMSATKSVVNLAVGRLIDQKKIKSIDQPVFDFYPEWKQGRKAPDHHPPSPESHQRASERSDWPGRSTPARTSSNLPWRPN